MLKERYLALRSGSRAVARAGGLVLAACLISGSAFGTTDPPSTVSQPSSKTGAAHTPKKRSPQAQRAVASHDTAKVAAHGTPAKRTAANPPADEVAALKQQLTHQEELIAAQQKQISSLVDAMQEQKELLEKTLHAAPERAANNTAKTQSSSFPSLGDVASLQPVVPLPGTATNGVSTTLLDLSVLPASSQPASTASAQNAQAEQPVPAYQQRVDQLSKAVDNLSQGIAGFHFSGDLRLRSDNIWRSANADGAAEQNLRGRMRARLNIDRGIGDQLTAHLQIGSGNFDNPLTDDTDFGGSATPGPIFLREAWINYHPNSIVNLQGGRMYDVFQDGTRFMWDEDVRFDGFQESVGVSPADNVLGVTRVDVRAGQYVLTNPNVQVLPSASACTSTPQTITSLPATITTPATLPAACAYLSAGYSPGENVRAADMFDQGVFIKGTIDPAWSHYFYSDFVAYRNPDQIALASTSAGLPVLVNTIPGVTLATTLPGTGNALTKSGGGIYSADGFQIVHVAYRITYDGAKLKGESFPVFLDAQASRNVGTSYLRNAWMATIDAGKIEKAGDVRFQYAYGEKDANSMISQYTDDQFGTNSGVNVRTHAIRFDVGLSRYMQWQNIFYIQNPISGNDAAKHFFVPVPLGVNTQYRAQSSIMVTF